MIKDRLSKPFDDFDSIDPRMERVPLDLRDNNLRRKYLRNHEEWFLRNHRGSFQKFSKLVKEMYDEDVPHQESSETRQLTLIDVS